MGFFKGRSKNKNSNIVYHKEVKQGIKEVAETKYLEEIETHFNKVFPGRKEIVFHEIISSYVHIDVHIMYPTEKEPFYIIYTTGMSDLPMTLPEEILPEYKCLELAELMMMLPGSWNFEYEKDAPEEDYWPIRHIKEIAKLPHEYETWLGYGHTIPNGADYKSYSKDTKLSCLLLLQLVEEISIIKTKDQNQMNIYNLVPIHKKEALYKLEFGVEKLAEKLFEENEVSLIVDKKRKCVV